jgi:hypothetical protein
VEELQLALTAARIDQRNFGLWLNAWQVGQTLNALVTAQRPTGELVLRVGGQQITATADIPIQQGTRLLLEVKQLQPVPTLRVLNPTAGPAATEVGGTLRLITGAGVGQGVAGAPLASVAQALQSMPAAAAASAAQISAALLPLKTLLRELGRPVRLASADGLAAALRESGLFLEASLGAGRAARGAGEGLRDLKGLLFRALGAVDGALGRVEALSLKGAEVEALLALKGDLEAGLGRIAVQQFNSLPAEVGAARQWHFEVPVPLAGEFHTLRLAIEGEGEGGGASGAGDAGDDERWSAKLWLDPPGLASLELQLTLAGDVLELRAAAERAATRSLIGQGLPLLEAALASRGLELHSTAVAELRSATDGDPDPEGSRRLDLRA